MDPKVAKKLGERLRKYRENSGYTQAQVAEKSGKSVETISNFERGKTVPSLGTLHELANHLGISLKDLVDFHDTSSSQPADDLAARIRLLTRNEFVLADEFIRFLAGRKRKKASQ